MAKRDANDLHREAGADAVRDAFDKTSRKTARKKAKPKTDNQPHDFNGQGDPHHDDARPAIALRAGALHLLAAEAEAALVAANVPFYSRGGEIVRPIVDDVPAFHGRRTKVARLKAVSIDTMRDYLSRVARFEKYHGRSKKMVAADPPQDIARTILARDGDWQHFLPLAGIITTPTLRPDGSMLSEAGYDPTTRLLLLVPPPLPAIPSRPNKDDALAAIELLDGLLSEFPFVNTASRSVALSALMTPVVRGAMRVAPMHAFDAPEAGSGKSYLIDLASAIATGEIAPVIAAGRDEAETEKRLVAELITAQPIISIDNFNGDLGGDLLCQAIERQTIKPRILGYSETKRINNTVCMFGNGNNFRVVGDMVRRVIRGSLDANMEEPELRHFKGDPLASVLANRGRYIAAVLIIVRAYLIAGCPNLLPPLASFEDWSRLVRSPLAWLGYADPVETTKAARADDPSRANLRAIVAAMLDVIGPNRPKTAGEIKDTACSMANDPDGILNKALIAVACPRGRNEIDPLLLGKWFGRNKGRVAGDHKIIGEPDEHTKQMLWSVTNKNTKEQTVFS
jgi:putative DNA primase/helicase